MELYARELRANDEGLEDWAVECEILADDLEEFRRLGRLTPRGQRHCRTAPPCSERLPAYHPQPAPNTEKTAGTPQGARKSYTVEELLTLMGPEFQRQKDVMRQCIAVHGGCQRFLPFPGDGVTAVQGFRDAAVHLGELLIEWSRSVCRCCWTDRRAWR